MATRNYIGVLSSVNCSATVVRAIEDHFRTRGLSDYPNVDGIVALPQSFGCAFGSDSEMMKVMRRTMAGYATHANFAGIVIVGLGCESFQIKDMMNAHGLHESPVFHTMTIQESGGTRNAIEKVFPSFSTCSRKPTMSNENQFRYQKSFWLLSVAALIAIQEFPLIRLSGTQLIAWFAREERLFCRKHRKFMEQNTF
ncbi:UxaA family hydrolase [Escherichia coli]